MRFISLVFLAGGCGTRFGTPLPKQFQPLLGKPLIHYSLELFDEMDEISEIIVVCEEVYQPYFKAVKKKIHFAAPGKERWNSVSNGVKKCSPETSLILTHDSARPFIEKKIVLATIEAAFRTGAAAPGVASVNTIKQCNLNRRVEKTLERSRLWEMQTPQALLPDLFHRGLALANEQSLAVTDDLFLAELLGISPEVVPSVPHNFKVTTPFDWKVAEAMAGS